MCLPFGGARLPRNLISGVRKTVRVTRIVYENMCAKASLVEYSLTVLFVIGRMLRFYWQLQEIAATAVRG
jgi:hypothetical protein